MEQKREQTNHLLAESLKALMMKKPFEKITIKEITDEAGVIRPTFYNHFADKYALMEWIFKTEIIEPTWTLLENDMMEEAACLMITKMKKEAGFYMAAFQIRGQNSFEGIVNECFEEIYLKMLKEKMSGIHIVNPLVTPGSIAKFYANGTTFLIWQWMENGMKATPKEVASFYVVLLSKTLETVICEVAEM